jgi:dihydroneopterin aldolase
MGLPEIDSGGDKGVSLIYTCPFKIRGHVDSQISFNNARRYLSGGYLWIDSTLVLISTDLMASVFDYDPLVVEIDSLARDGHYETQERLMTRIVEACAKYLEIESIEIGLKKLPVRSGTGSLGVRLSVDSERLNKIRSCTTSA